MVGFGEEGGGEGRRRWGEEIGEAGEGRELVELLEDELGFARPAGDVLPDAELVVCPTSARAHQRATPLLRVGARFRTSSARKEQR